MFYQNFLDMRNSASTTTLGIKQKIERDGEQLERPMSNNGLKWADDDEEYCIRDW
jgi:hypothetical protein